MSAEAPSPQEPIKPAESGAGDITDTSEAPSLSVIDGGKESRKPWFRLLRRNHKTGPDERHLHAVPDLPITPEHGHREPTTLSLEQQRDFAAIETFLKLNNDYFARRAGQPNRAETSARDAAVAYDHAMEIKIPESEPVKEHEPTPTYASMRAGLTEAPSLRGDPLSESFMELVDDTRDIKLKEAWEAHDPDSDIDDFVQEGDKIKKKYSFKQHKEHSWHDRQLQLSPDNKDNHYFTVEDRGLKNIEILDGYTPAILASTKAREDALSEGKTLDEAWDIGAEEYKKVVKDMEEENKEVVVRMSPEDRRKAAAIYAFNKAKSKVTRDGMRLVGNAQYGLDLRNNALKAFEHVMHMDLKFFEHDYDKPASGTSEATPTSPTSPNVPITAGAGKTAEQDSKKTESTTIPSKEEQELAKKSEAEQNSSRIKLGKGVLVIVGAAIKMDGSKTLNYVAHRANEKLQPLSDTTKKLQKKSLELFEKAVGGLSKENMNKVAQQINKATFEKIKLRRLKNDEAIKARIQAIEEYLAQKEAKDKIETE